MRKYPFLISLLILDSLFLAAQQKWDRPMELKKCSITIQADLFTATTFMEMEFCNPNDKEIEGLYRFELGQDQVITAFQLDLNGKYRDGSIEEKWKASNAYNRIVGKRVDPALLSMDYTGHYSLRIYPIPAKGCRKITITIQQLLSKKANKLLYSLPLNITNTVDSIKTVIKVNCNQLPLVGSGIISGESFEIQGGIFKLSSVRSNIFLNGQIAFTIPVPSSTFFCTKTTDHQTFFALRLNPSFPLEYQVHPKHLAIFWDVSASASKRDIKKEISFLKQFIAYHHISKLSISTFDYKIRDTITFTLIEKNENDWIRFLKEKEYDGATQLGCINLSGMPADIYMLFTDGNNTYGKSQPNTGRSLIYTVHTSNNANLNILYSIVGSSGGKVIDLNKITLSQAIIVNSKAENWLLDVTSASGNTITEQSYPLRINEPVFMNGTMLGSIDTLIFHYGNNNRTINTEKIIIHAHELCSSAPLHRLTMLNNFDKNIRSYSWENIIDYGLKEKIVTPNTSFIVLEKIEDYIQYNIEPPNDLKEECEIRNYVRKDTRSQRVKVKEVDEYETLNAVVSKYNERIKKWNADESPIVLNRSDFNKSWIETETNNLFKPTNGNNSPGELQGNAMGLAASSNRLDEVVVVGYATTSRRNLTSSVSVYNRNEIGYSTTIEQALQGRIAGLYASNTNAAPGSSASIQIRGISSLGANGEPLYVLDGIPVSGNINNLISTNDIESITVLKDAAACAIFGSRAANGAIIITSKKGKAYYRYPDKPYRLKDMEDVGYMQEIKETPIREKNLVYERLRTEEEENPGFYFDMAQHFFDIGLKNDAVSILMNAAEMSNGSIQVMRAMGYVFESWKMFDEAISIYEQLLSDDPVNLHNYRDLAWACYQNKNYQQSLETFYAGIKQREDVVGYSTAAFKSLLLSEMNALITLHNDELDISLIPAVLIRPMPVDLRIVLDCNKTSLGNVSIKEPNGKVCNYLKPVSKNGGVLNAAQYSYYLYNGPIEYTIKDGVRGKYKVTLNYYDYYSYPGKIPAFVRMVVYRNFGKPNQSIKIENVIMDNQYGEVEIGDINW